MKDKEKHTVKDISITKIYSNQILDLACPREKSELTFFQDNSERRYFSEQTVC